MIYKRVLLLAFFALASIQNYQALPSSNARTVGLTDATARLQHYFDLLTHHDLAAARQTLDHAIDSIYEMMQNRAQLIATHPRTLREAHVRSVIDTAQFFDNGRNGADILQLLLVDHLQLLFSIHAENKMIYSLMLSIYVVDVTAASSDVPYIPLTEERTTEVLKKHAFDYGYTVWYEFLEMIE